MLPNGALYFHSHSCMADLRELQCGVISYCTLLYDAFSLITIITGGKLGKRLSRSHVKQFTKFMLLWQSPVVQLDCYIVSAFLMKPIFPSACKVFCFEPFDNGIQPVLSPNGSTHDIILSGNCRCMPRL